MTTLEKEPTTPFWREPLAYVIGFISSIGAYALFVWDVLLVSIKYPPSSKRLRDEFYQIGVLSLPVVIITGFSTGLVLAAQSFFQLSDKGLASATGLMVAKAMTTELGPVITAFMITGRVGASMCAVLGTMQVTEQLDALRSMSVSPYRYLVAPRFIAGTFMVPVLTIFSGVLGVFGGYLLSVFFFGMAPNIYLNPIPLHVTTFDCATGFIKALVFGILISTISCYKGINTTGGAAGVGKATTNSVVICYVCILIANFLLTVGLNTARLSIGG